MTGKSVNFIRLCCPGRSWSPSGCTSRCWKFHASHAIQIFMCQIGMKRIQKWHNHEKILKRCSTYHEDAICAMVVLGLDSLHSIKGFADCATDAPRSPGADVPIAEEEDAAMDTTWSWNWGLGRIGHQRILRCEGWLNTETWLRQFAQRVSAKWHLLLQYFNGKLGSVQLSEFPRFRWQGLRVYVGTVPG